MIEHIYRLFGVKSEHSTTDELRVKVVSETKQRVQKVGAEYAALNTLIEDTINTLNTPK